MEMESEKIRVRRVFMLLNNFYATNKCPCKYVYVKIIFKTGLFITTNDEFCYSLFSPFYILLSVLFIFWYFWIYDAESMSPKEIEMESEIFVILMYNCKSKCYTCYKNYFLQKSNLFVIIIILKLCHSPNYILTEKRRNWNGKWNFCDFNV